MTSDSKAVRVRPTEKQLLGWDDTIDVLAKKRSRMAGIEYDDLFQEGRVAVMTAYMLGSEPTEQLIVNAIRRYIRAVKETRTVVYEPEIRSLVPLWDS